MRFTVVCTNLFWGAERMAEEYGKVFEEVGIPLTLENGIDEYDEEALIAYVEIDSIDTLMKLRRKIDINLILHNDAIEIYDDWRE